MRIMDSGKRRNNHLSLTTFTFRTAMDRISIFRAKRFVPLEMKLIQNPEFIRERRDIEPFAGQEEWEKHRSSGVV
jgi:hypothetical protein